MGVTSDRIGHRNLLFGMRAIYAVLAATLMTLAFVGAVTPLIVLVIATLMGLVRPSDLGVRSALVAETMPSDSADRRDEHLAHHDGLGARRRRARGRRRVRGVRHGAGLCDRHAASMSLGSLLMLGDRSAAAAHLARDDAGGSGTSPWRDLKDGIAQVWNTPILLAVVWLAFLANLTAFPLTNGLLPYVAKDVYALDQTGLGYLVARFAGGALLGSIVLSHVGAGVHG